MKIDDYNRSIFDSGDLFDLIYEHGPDILENLIVKQDNEIQKFNELSNNLISVQDTHTKWNSLESFDIANQQNWFMPDEYQNMDIEGFLVSVCPKENYQRLIDELQEYRSRNMLDLLRWLKYFVDTLRAKNIVWGVGRGSSVASYVLYLIGVHKINSIKHKLDWKEFLR